MPALAACTYKGFSNYICCCIFALSMAFNARLQLVSQSIYCSTLATLPLSVSLALSFSVGLSAAKFAVNLRGKTVQKLKVLIYNLQTFTLSIAHSALVLFL